MWQNGRISDLGRAGPIDINDRGQIVLGRSGEGIDER